MSTACLDDLLDSVCISICPSLMLAMSFRQVVICEEVVQKLVG